MSTSTEASSKVFPWGSNSPTRRQRIVVALLIAGLGAGWFLLETHSRETGRTDFGIVWFGARALIEGRNPYPLVGPGLEFEWDYPLLYPATALTAAIPFALLTERIASFAFVTLSCFLLAYGITRTSWHLLPIFASEAFASSARLAQWSIILSAALFLPWLSALAAAKPQAGIPLVAASKRPGLLAAVAGGLALLALSLLLLPSWLRDWLSLVRDVDHMRAPISGIGGFLLVALLLRWRRPEAWLIMILAVMPQTWLAYNTLMLLTVAATFREAAGLVLISTAGAVAVSLMLGPIESTEGFYTFLATSQLITVYFPAAVIVLRRSNSGEPPAWLVALGQLRYRHWSRRARNGSSRRVSVHK